VGPIALFDKSFLQSLNVDEAVLFDHFFLPVISPLFFVETLADLSREPDLLAPSEVIMNAQDQKNKILSVRMILSGVVPRKLVPEKKGYGL